MRLRGRDRRPDAARDRLRHGRRAAIGAPDVFEASNVILGVGDPEYVQTMEDLMAAFMTLHQMAMELGEHRLANPPDDIATILMQAEVDGERLTVPEFASFFILLVVAGNETTRTAISHGMWALHETPTSAHCGPRTSRRTRQNAVEEIVRWASPVIHFRRTATQDTEIGGQPIAEGEKIVMWFNSANRDEHTFTDPYRFDITRSPNPHVGYGGGGPHFCLGANLARREIRVMFEQLFNRCPTWRSRRTRDPPVHLHPRHQAHAVRVHPVAVADDAGVSVHADLAPFDPGSDRSSTRRCASRRGTSGRATPRGKYGRPIDRGAAERRGTGHVLLVEVWDEPGGRSQAEELAAALGGYEHVHASNLIFADGVHAGNAILSRWPIAGPKSARCRATRPTAPATTTARNGSVSSPRSTGRAAPSRPSARTCPGGRTTARSARNRSGPSASSPARPDRVRCPHPRRRPERGARHRRDPDAHRPRRDPGPGIWFRDAWVHAGDGPGFTWSNTNPWAATSLDVDRRIDYVLVGHPKLGGVGHRARRAARRHAGRRGVRLGPLRPASPTSATEPRNQSRATAREGSLVRHVARTQFACPARRRDSAAGSRDRRGCDAGRPRRRGRPERAHRSRPSRAAGSRTRVVPMARASAARLPAAGEQRAASATGSSSGRTSSHAHAGPRSDATLSGRTHTPSRHSAIRARRNAARISARTEADRASPTATAIRHVPDHRRRDGASADSCSSWRRASPPTSS